MSFDAMFRRVQRKNEQKKVAAEEKAARDAIELPPAIDPLQVMGWANGGGA